MSLRTSKPSYVYSIIGVSLVLFLLGILGWLMLNGRALSRAFQEDIEVQVDFHDNTRPENIDKLNAILEAQPFTRKTRIITKEEALQTQSELEGENIEDFLGYNPLFSSIALNLHADYVNPDSLNKIKAFLLQSNVVRDVTYPTMVVTQMNSNFRRMGIILGGVSLLLVIAVVALIDNTVRLAMFSNRFLIKTMQMVGATRKFIVGPFDRRAIINGLISGIIASVLLFLVMSFSEKQLPTLALLHDTSSFLMLMGVLLLLGILISLLSTHRSVIKYLKMQVEDLY